MRPRLATALSSVAWLWACGATIYLVGGAGGSRILVDSAVAGGESAVGHLDVSMASANGVWVVILLSLVTLLAGIPLGVALRYPARCRAATLSVGLLLLGFSVVAGFSVGLAYLPCALALLASGTMAGDVAVLGSSDPRGP